MAITGRDALRRDTAQVFGDADARARRSSDDEVYVSGLYASPAEADRAYQHLRDTYGYDDGDIDVLMSDETRRQHYGNGEAETEPTGGTKAAEGLGAGSAIGGTVGAALGALFAVGSSMVIPGIGLVVAGPVAAALAGAGAGGATGGLIGALVGAGIPEERAVIYERGISEGGVVLGTRARDLSQAEQLERDFGAYGGRDVYR